MKKLVTLAAAVAIAVPLMASQVQAQFSLVPYIGYNFAAGFDVGSFDADDRVGAFLVGAGVDIGFPMDGPVGLSLRPTVEYMFLPGESFQEMGLDVDVSQSRLQVNIDVVAQFGAPGAVAPYAGAGLAWSSYRLKGEFCFNGQCTSGSESESGIGFNLLGGVELGTVGFGRPFIQGRYTILSIDGEDDFGNEESFDLNAFTLTAGMIIPLGR